MVVKRLAGGVVALLKGMAKFLQPQIPPAGQPGYPPCPTLIVFSICPSLFLRCVTSACRLEAASSALDSSRSRSWPAGHAGRQVVRPLPATFTGAGG